MSIFKQVDLRNIECRSGHEYLEAVEAIETYPPTVQACSKVNPLSDHIRKHPWLTAFYGDDGQFDDALAALHDNPNGATLAMLDFDRHTRNALIVLKFQERIGEAEWTKSSKRAKGMRTALASGSSEALYTPMRVYSSLNDILKLASDNFDSTGWYAVLAQRVASFCLIAGLPKAERDIETNISTLRSYLSSRSSSSREASLEQEVQRLQKLVNKQQRIITNLTYRYLMEHLPTAWKSTSQATGSGVTTKPQSSTQSWQTFFRTTFKNASTATIQTGPNPHPFTTLLQQEFDKRSWPQLEQVGAGLYGTVSANIHHFASEYKVDEDQWGAMEGALLKAMTPTEFDSHGNVDWAKEAAKY